MNKESVIPELDKNGDLIYDEETINAFKIQHDLAEQLFSNLSKGSDIARELGDDRFAAVLATLSVLIYNNQQDLINEVFTHFQEEIFPRVEQPKQREATCQRIQ